MQVVSLEPDRPPGHPTNLPSVVCQPAPDGNYLLVCTSFIFLHTALTAPAHEGGGRKGEGGAGGGKGKGRNLARQASGLYDTSVSSFIYK